MRTKTLLLTAALSAAGLATSMAQVYSVNAVGYVNQTVPANGYAILAMPLNNPTNDINLTLPLAADGSQDGCALYRFNPTTQRYYETIFWSAADGGWLAEADGDRMIAPGEGFFLRNITGSPLTVTFVGEVLSGNQNNPIQGGNGFSIRGAQIPKGGRLGWNASATRAAMGLEFPAEDGDALYVFNSATQRYRETYFYSEADGGWLHDIDPLEGPDVQPGTGLFTRKALPTKQWQMSFSVQ